MMTKPFMSGTMLHGIRLTARRGTAWETIKRNGATLWADTLFFCWVEVIFSLRNSAKHTSEWCFRLSANNGAS